MGLRTNEIPAGVDCKVRYFGEIALLLFGVQHVKQQTIAPVILGDASPLRIFVPKNLNCLKDHSILPHARLYDTEKNPTSGSQGNLCDDSSQHSEWQAKVDNRRWLPRSTSSK
jgi:hypothetical protein